jgi:hypothetical protein
MFEIIKEYTNQEIIDRIREVTLIDGVTKPYKNSRIAIVWLGIDDIKFAQEYVLESEIKKVERIHDHNMWAEEEIYPSCRVKDNESGHVFDYIPPVVEVEKDGTFLLNDGMHRVFTYYYERFCYEGIVKPIEVILIFDPAVPYYAYPSPMRWSKLVPVDKKPKVTKRYRRPKSHHKELFRNFNSQFLNVQGVRA